MNDDDVRTALPQSEQAVEEETMGETNRSGGGGGETGGSGKGPASPDPARAASSTYDVESAKKLLVQAQRRTDIMIRQSSASGHGGGGSSPGGGGGETGGGGGGHGEAGEDAYAPRGVLAAAGQWLHRQTEERRREELAYQVERQRRKLKKAIKRISRDQVDNGGGDDSNHGGDSYSGSASAHGSDETPDTDHPSHAQDTTATPHANNHPYHHHGGGGICGAITGAASADSSSSSDTGTSAGSSSDPLVNSPQLTATGTGLHVEVRIPDVDLTHEKTHEAEESMPEVAVVPEPPTNHKFCPYILTPTQMKRVAAQVLPPSVRYCKWQRLYSLARDGDSFDAFLRLVAGSKRTLLVVTTSRGCVMGAYADSPWESTRHHRASGAAFYGSAQACLWRLARRQRQGQHQQQQQGGDTTAGTEQGQQTAANGSAVDGRTTTNPDSSDPNNNNATSSSKRDNDQQSDSDEIVVYRWTGANRYIQICDAHAKILALGGGGVEGEFGLCVEDDFRRGSTGRCLTFGNDPLCDQDRFDIVDLECWGFPIGFA